MRYFSDLEFAIHYPGIASSQEIVGVLKDISPTPETDLANALEKTVEALNESTEALSRVTTMLDRVSAMLSAYQSIEYRR